MIKTSVTGRIFKIFKSEKFSDKFSKRTIVIETKEQYNQHVSMTYIQDRPRPILTNISTTSQDGKSNTNLIILYLKWTTFQVRKIWTQNFRSKLKTQINQRLKHCDTFIMMLFVFFVLLLRLLYLLLTF
jgi:hypothetical protein